MYEFWLKEKLIFIIGLFQFGLILIMFAIVNLSKLIWRKLTLDKQDVSNQNNLNEIKSAAIAPSSPNNAKDPVNNLVNNEISLEEQLTERSEELLVAQPSLTTENISLPEDDLTYKVEIAPELLKEIKEISSDPATVIDEAIRWWLRRRTLDVLNSSDDRPYRVGMRSNRSQRSQQDLWND
ncbi:MAG: hypothetical protein DCF20_14860 [Pseudanabaena sp.]|nr:MAG: hypothetical protein DCF20_14860 [Pseudanabaena sp.]